MPTDRELLQEFLNAAEEILSQAATDANRYLRQELRPLFQAAWSEIRPVVPRIRLAIDTTPELRFRDNGLTGAQLSLKLAGFNAAREALLTRGWIREVLDRVLRWMNVILGSLAKAIPLAEVLKEYKESVEAALQEAE